MPASWLVAAAFIAGAPGATADPKATDVSELVVTATRSVSELVVTAPLTCLPPEGTWADARARPHIVSSFPRPGQVVRPGLVVMRLTFDTPMTCSGDIRGDASVAADPCPKGVEKMLLSVDRRTVRTLCFLAPGKRYLVWGSRFQSITARPAEPYKFEFSTSEGTNVLTACDALVEDAETAALIAQRRPLDCAGATPNPADVQEAENLRRQAGVEQLEQEAARVEAAARDLAQAQGLAEAAYSKALAGLRAKAARAAEEAKQLSEQTAQAEQKPTPPSRSGAEFDATARVRTARRSPPKGQAPVPPGVSLDEWTYSLTVNGHAFACHLLDGAVHCEP